MGKRSRKEKDEEYLKKKIRKLERKLKELPEKDVVLVTPSLRASPTPNEIPIVQDLEPSNNPAANEDMATITEDELPEDYLLALGAEGAENSQVGDPIRTEIVLRWSNIMNDGLDKEQRDAILKKYPTPTNFQKAEAPILNPEISASLSDISMKRNKRIIHRQFMIGKLMTSLGKSLMYCLTEGNINSKVLIEEINDAAKIAADIHHQDSSSRRFFALAGAEKTVQEAFKNVKIDNFLFGADCPEKLKAAQALKRTGSQIKATPSQQSIPTNSVRKQVNWKGPLQHQHQTRSGLQNQQRPSAFKKHRFYQPPQKGQRRPPPRSKSRHHH